MSTTKPIPGTEIQIGLGRAFKRERDRTGTTLDQLAKGLGVSINTIRWHQEGARCDDLIKAAGIIGCPPTELMRFD